MSHEKSSIGCLTSKCAISVMKSYQNLIMVVRSKNEVTTQNSVSREVIFYEACKTILEKAQVLSDLINDERKEKKHHPQIMYLLQLIQIQVSCLLLLFNLRNLAFYSNLFWKLLGKNFGIFLY